MRCKTCGNISFVSVITVDGGQRFEIRLCEGCAARVELEDDVNHRLADAKAALTRLASARIPDHRTAPKPCECGRAPTVHVGEKQRGERKYHHLCENCFLQRLEPSEAGFLAQWMGRGRASLEEMDRFLADLDARFGPLPRLES
jgi:protein-arginine kinase activator protein McsA